MAGSEPHTPPRSDGGSRGARSRRWLARRETAYLAVAAFAVVVAVVALVVGLTGGDGDDGKTTTAEGPGGAEVSLLEPEGWSSLPESERERLRGKPIAVLRRDDRRGIVVVNARERRVDDLDRVSRQLDRRLRRAVPDFRRVRSRRVRVKAGEALLYSYVRGRQGTAHTLLVVPQGSRSYTLNAVVPAGARTAAREAGRILLTFDA